MIRVEVAVAAPLDQPLLYDLERELVLAATGNTEPIGLRVQVPLGRRSVTGYILAVLETGDVAYTVRKVSRVLDPAPLFPLNMLPFFRWAASYYQYPLGLVIKSALPSGLAPKSVREIVLLAGKKPDLERHFTSRMPDWAAELLAEGCLPAERTREVLARKAARQDVDTLIGNGVVEVRDRLLKDSVQQKMETCFEISLACSGFQEMSQKLETHLDHGKSSIMQQLRRSERRTLDELFSLMTENGTTEVPAQDLYRRYPGARKSASSLLEKGLIGKRHYRVYRSPFGEPMPAQSRPEHLTPGQQEVLAELEPALAARAFRTFLLHGVTGCGKTEVYLRAAEKVLALGRDVLVLVPEIALATQLEAQFLSRFGDAVVLLHSGLTGAERFDQWHLALCGSAKIVIGARSALFAPLKDPGLIVVDEEHDGGFKQDDTFRYHGRDLAVLRGRFNEAVVLLGSATPAVTSYHNAVTGKYTLLTISERVGEKSLPAVTITDLSRKKQDGEKGLFRRELRQALADNLEKGQQSLLLLNRRGFSPVMLCQECGSPVECLHCRVSLTLHRAKGQLVCHYCGYAVDHRVICSSCHSTGSMVPVGFGTERVEEEVRLLLPGAKVARLDSDSAADRKVFLKMLRAMHEREIDILVGTQMIAKGHHFPHVTLVGVVFADSGLNMPDYRAAEKTFQLITQVTGRAGRGDAPGRVIIQTMRPEHYSIALARQHKYRELYEHELQLRRSPLFPPHVRLVALHIQGEDEGEVRVAAQRIAGVCREEKKKVRMAAEILGPAPSPIERLNRNYRWQILLKASEIEELHRLCRRLLEARQETVPSACRLIIDVDPENMM